MPEPEQKYKDPLKSTYEDIVNKMYEEGRIKTLSTEATADIDRKLSEGFKKIKEESEIKQRKSRAYAFALESGLLSILEKKSLISRCWHLAKKLFRKR